MTDTTKHCGATAENWMAFDQPIKFKQFIHGEQDEINVNS
jgi:hypothetical protein